MDIPLATDAKADQEALARGYHQPVSKEPDPVYVVKASLLCQTFGNYQDCRPRAVNFSHYETVYKLKRKDQIDEEYGSMSLTSSIKTWCDHRKWNFEDIRGEVLSLLRDLAGVGAQPDTNPLTLPSFNDEEIYSAIFYYFRLLATTTLKVNSVADQDFILDGQGVGIFEDMQLPLNTEIENVGLTVLINVLMRPMSIEVEIVYPDKHVISHLIRAEDDNGIPISPGGPIVHLLYRPGHYDTLYKYTNACRSLRQQQTIASAASNILINRGGAFSRVLDPSPMPNLNRFNPPGSVNMVAMSNHGFPSTHTPLGDYEPILTPTSPFDTPVWTPNMQYSPPIPAVSPLDSGTPMAPAAAPSIHSAPSRPQRTLKPQDGVPASSVGNEFGHSKYEYWIDPSAQNFQTSSLNSHYNTAHHSHPNFQPEDWSPADAEEPRTRLTNHKSTST